MTAYVRFAIEQHSADGAVKVIAANEYQVVAENPIKFSLAYREQAIDDGATIFLVTRVAADPQGLSEITSMTSLIDDDARDRYIYLAIELAPEPLAQNY